MEPVREDYVSFETAKLLKEKGFNSRCRYSFYKDKDNIINESVIDDPNVFPWPTQALAVKWLRIKHDIHITVTVTEYLHYIWNITVSPKESYRGMENFLYFDKTVNCPINFIGNSYEEAIEAAIKYSLINLVK